MIVVRILGWNSHRAWTNGSGHERTDLVWRLGRLSNLDRREIKRLARRILDQEHDEIQLDKAQDRFAAESLRSFLESLGAAAVVEDV